MKRSIPRSLILQPTPGEARSAPAETEPDDTRPIKPGAGSAWKSGALAQTQSALERGREALVADILAGRHELSILPEQITDPIGSDRRDDWKTTEAFRSLLQSIEANGQDTPVLVWPEDPDWQPDPLDPMNVEGVRFWMLTGRRRHAAAQELGRPLRAVLAPPGVRGSRVDRFEMLFLRFRENEERENLSAFERLVSIGEMFDTLARDNPVERLTATSFADRIGVHESIVSRARAVFRLRDEILNTFKNVYDMSFRDLQAALAQLNETPAARPKPKPKPKRLEVSRKIAGRRLSVSSGKDGLLVKAAGLRLDEPTLERLSDAIAAVLEQTNASDPKT